MRIRASHAALGILKLGVVVQLVVGIAMWSGHWYDALDLHRTTGVVVVASLWTIAMQSLVQKRSQGAAGFALAWGVLIVAVGFMQGSILPGEFHWITRVAHLVIGVSAVPIAEDLVRALRGQSGGKPTMNVPVDT